MLPVKLTNEDIKNFAAYKEYYAIASGAASPKTKASVRKTQSGSDTTIPPLTAASTRLLTSAKGKQPGKSFKAKGLSVLSEVALTEAEHMKLATKRSLQQTYISQASGFGVDKGTDDDDDVDDQSETNDDRSDDQEDEYIQDDDQDDNDDDQDTDNEGDDFVHPKLSIHEEEAKDKESFDPIIQTPKNSNDEGNDDVSLGMNIGGEEGQDAEDDDEELYRDININLEGRDIQMTDSSSVSSQFVTSMLNPSPDAGIDSLFESTPRVDVQALTTVAPLTLTAPTLPPPTIPTISQFPGAVSSILEIVERYINQRMTEAVKLAVQIQSDRLQNEAQAKNEEFLNKLDTNIQKIIKEQVKEQVKLKKILIEKMESNKSIHRSDQQKNLYKALVDAYECDKIILDIYGDLITFKRRRDDVDKDEEPSAGSDWGSKKRREGKEPESTSAPKEKDTKTTEKSTKGSKSHQKTSTGSLLEMSTQNVESSLSPNFRSSNGITTSIWIESLKDDKSHGQKTLCFQRLSKNVHKKHRHPMAYERSSTRCRKLLKEAQPHKAGYVPFRSQADGTLNDVRTALDNRLKGIRMKYLPQNIWRRSDKERAAVMIQAINKQLKTRRIMRSLEKFVGGRLYEGTSGCYNVPYDLSYDVLIIQRESARDVYSKRRIIAVTELQIVEWHNYKHLDWITVRRDDDKLYKFKEGDFKRLRIQDIEDMLLLLVQGKLTNLTVEKRFAFNVSLRMFTRSIII
uniref:Uncharacterized protein n=1 Tax=Tanacetum cinerariifolium TaxID=118510 RepID=A0A6L2NTT3_TANCI|nr:hypothetical protein [Tanacetum cinerariifolium]